MISSANDRVDREDIRQQSDETYQFWFYYDTSQCAAVHKFFLHAIDATPVRWRLRLTGRFTGTTAKKRATRRTASSRREMFIAITTAGSTVFLLACQLTFFTAMGTLIILTVAYSLGYSLLFFMPLLRVAGPEGRVGDICHFLRGLKCACCRRA